MKQRERKILLTIDNLKEHYMKRFLFITKANNEEIFRWCDHIKENPMYSLEDVARDNNIEMLIYYDTFMSEKVQKYCMEYIKLIGYDATIYYH